ncbi:glycoside hydrolase family 36 protein [Georgenia faecalis]|uniref:Glycoside hydrolase family 36 protein n=1 Tax=Georgenia faecalis TaxID=2483799 RepID=A0ABV9D7M5_9MICO|nr:glycoside hydrolase family 36 protein [Georgenia faecalis]
MNAQAEEVGAVAVGPHARVYAEGWQSWSPATWYPADGAVPRPDLPWQHTMRLRPGTPLADALQGEGVLVVDPGDGRPAHAWVAAAPTEHVPTLTARTHGDHVVVAARGGDVRELTAPDGTAALAAVGDALAQAAARPALRAAPRVWCTWYRYFEAVTADDVRDDLRAMDRLDLPVDVVQVDDGWTLGLGEELAPNPAFGFLDRLVDDVHAAGRRVGLWVAPFLVGRDSTLARRHPDWVMGDAGENWGTGLVGVDLTHPDLRAHLHRWLADLVARGVDYLKLDFLYGGALPGRRHEESGEVAAYRSGLALVRDAVGPDTYLLGCGAPLLPSIGLVDAMRVSPDTFHAGGQDGSAGLRGRLSLEGRAWQHGRLWVADPDCVVARPSFPLRHEWAAVARRSGGLRSVSDRLEELDDDGVALVREYLAAPVPPGPLAGSPG